MTNASLSFVPWVRQGAASAIKDPDTLGVQPAYTTVTPDIRLNTEVVQAVALRLRGPADVIGIDPNQVVRTDPRPATSDFESNCFPSIEFDRADFPWLFTPACANADTRLRPWLCLVVVRKQPGVTVTSVPNAPLPQLRIAAPAKPALELPDLTDCWAWAHAQAAADYDTAANATMRQVAVSSALNGTPDMALSRLICPRVLEAETDYIACVVPTFAVGQKAGLGLPIVDKDLASGTALTPAWSFKPVPAEVLLPVYYQWEFRTGAGGNFETLARNLSSFVPEGLGERTVDISHPGFEAAGATTIKLEGALLPIAPTAATPAPEPTLPAQFKANLADILNKPSTAEITTPAADPLLAPPIYGRWHAGKMSVAPTGTTWLDEINVDPRRRVAAAFGTRVIQDHQEALMASAWEQAGDLPSANQRMRQIQLSLSVGEVLRNRHFAKLTEEMTLRIAAPAFPRLQIDGQSLLVRQSNSMLPIGANRSAMRRIGRLRGPLSRRIAAQGVARSATPTWIARLNTTAAPLPQLPPLPPREFAVRPRLPFQHLEQDSFFGAQLVAPEYAPATPLAGPKYTVGKIEIPGFFRTAALTHMARIYAARTIPVPAPLLPSLVDVKTTVMDKTQSRIALAAVVSAAFETGGTVLSATAPGVPSTGFETVMAAPHFAKPMYEALRDMSQDLFLPGLDTIKQDSVIGLRTNRQFVESYMVGLNHEMGRELLWRGYPTDQRGTYFANFWGLGDLSNAPDDITPLNTWHERSLGDAAGAPSSEQFVMLLRSKLLARYPNAVIYMAQALPSTTVPGGKTPSQSAIMPLFSGSMQPDVSFFGFPITTDVATGKDGGLGYFVILQEHPTEPRFGFDLKDPLVGTNHMSVGKGLPADAKNSAEIAHITRRLPTRMAIHAARLITPA